MRPLDPAKLRERVAAGMSGEGERLALWLPVAFVAGALIYFALPEEPWPFWPVLAATAAGILWWPVRTRAWAPLAAIALMTLAAGWGWSQVDTARTAAPMLEKEAWGVAVRGRVVDVDPQDGSAVRVILDRLEIEGFEPAATPERIRVSFRASDRPAQPGDTLVARAVLRPPSPPVAPRGYDFQRDAWFARIGAVGFALGAVSLEPPPEAPEWSAAILIEHLRRAIATDIGAALDGPVGGLAIALVVGERGTIHAEDDEAMRAAGLSHLIAISGLHIGIVAGFVFWTTRAGMALIEPVAVRYPIKKWAAVMGLLGALVYTLVAGLTPPTLRSFLMVAVALLAMIIDRNPISMRLVGLAAVLVIMVTPSTAVGPSFQLSFAAVVALIAAFERADARRTLLSAARERPRYRLPIYLGVVCYSSLVATVATTPFSLYHFQQVAVYGIVANLVAIPLMAFWVVPLLAIGCLASIVGLGEVGFVPAGWGIELIRLVAHEVAGWPGSVLRAPAAEGWTLVLAAAGGLWLCLWRSSVRWLGAVPVVAAMAAMFLGPRPVLFVSGFGDPVAVVAADGERLLVPSLRRDRFTTGAWARLAGLAPDALAELAGTSERDGIRCDAFGCVVETGGGRVALGRSRDAMEEDCVRAELVIQLYPGSEACPNGTRTIRYLDLVIDGGHVVTVGSDGGLSVGSVGADRGRRPWTVTAR